MKIDKPIVFSNPNIYDIIIPIYNGYNYLEPLFRSLRNGTTIPHRIIIVNDYSTDDRVSKFLNDINKYQNQFCLEIIVNNNIQNLGFVKSVNFAVTITKNHFVILNTDTEVPLGWLERLMRPIEYDNSIASVTPLTNSGTICSFPNWLEDNDLAFGLPLEKIDNVIQDLNDQTLVEVPTGVGFCMAINFYVVKKIGFFDADTFGRGYGEENDWCMRAKAAGYKNVVIRNLFVYHKHGGSFGESKKKLAQKNYLKLLKKHPQYGFQVKKFIQSQPMKNLYDKLSFKLFLQYKPAIIFCHNWGGGSESFISEHLYNDIDNEKIILIRGTNFKNNIEFIDNKKNIFKLTIETLDEILNILSEQTVYGYYINHLVQFDNLPNDIEKFIQFFNKVKKQPVYYLHDYFSICPTINLINSDRRYCGVPSDMQICNQCLANNKEFVSIKLSPDSNMQNWRKQFGILLSMSGKIYVFSNSSIPLLLKAYPNLIDKVETYSLRLTKLPTVVTNIDFSRKKKIKVGVLGTIGHIKGLDVIQQLAIIINNLSLPIELIIIGSTLKPVKYIKVTGKYQKSKLADICLNKEIDLFVIPSIWPETYCYTVDEVMNLGYPLLCFNLGAPAERVINYQYGFIIDEINSVSLLKKIIAVSEKYGFILFSYSSKERVNCFPSDKMMLRLQKKVIQIQKKFSWRVIRYLQHLADGIKKRFS